MGPFFSLSSFCRSSAGFGSDDWPGLSNSFIFFLWEFPWLCLGASSPRNVHPLYHPGRLKADFNLSIHPSSNYMKEVPYAEKQPCTMMSPPSNFTVGVVLLGWHAVPLDLYGLISLCVWIGWVVADGRWEFHVDGTFRNIFAWKMGDMFNTKTSRQQRERNFGYLNGLVEVHSLGLHECFSFKMHTFWLLMCCIHASSSWSSASEGS